MRGLVYRARALKERVDAGSQVLRIPGVYEMIQDSLSRLGSVDAVEIISALHTSIDGLLIPFGADLSGVLFAAASQRLFLPAKLVFGLAAEKAYEMVPSDDASAFKDEAEAEIAEHYARTAPCYE